MKTYYQEILNAFHDDEEIKKAVLSHNALIYKYLTWIMMQNSLPYRSIKLKEGKETADRLLRDCLVIFRRQVNHDYYKILIKKEKIINGNSNSELVDHLVSLFKLMEEISPLNPFHEAAEKYEKEMVEGRGLLALELCRPLVYSALHKAGCTNQEDKEDIFTDARMIFWQKLKNNETGLFLTGQSNDISNCHVYNKSLFQNSKLCTFLAGISINLFLNLTRTSEFRISKKDLSHVPDTVSDDQVSEDNARQLKMLYNYYRNCVEPRKIRTIISMLQYDCDLEEKEVKGLLGINNARFHSSRLRENFVKWQKDPRNRQSAIIDASNEYLTKKESQDKKLNEKLLIIDRFERGQSNHVDLNKFREEFRSHNEFHKYRRLFMISYYLVSQGKASRFTGLLDEMELRMMMGSYKNIILELEHLQALLIFLFYAAEEPEESIIGLLLGLHSELPRLDPKPDFLKKLIDQMNDHVPSDPSQLADELYASNGNLFMLMSEDNYFINFVN